MSSKNFGFFASAVDQNLPKLPGDGSRRVENLLRSSDQEFKNTSTLCSNVIAKNFKSAPEMVTFLKHHKEVLQENGWGVLVRGEKAPVAPTEAQTINR